MPSSKGVKVKYVNLCFVSSSCSDVSGLEIDVISYAVGQIALYPCKYWGNGPVLARFCLNWAII